MANLDFDNDEGPVNLMHRRAALNLATSMDDDPEEMARALQLSQSSGVPAPVIKADVEGFEKEHKADLSNEVVKRNQFLQAYFADETAARLSHDDVGPLDQASESIGKLSQPAYLRQRLDGSAAQIDTKGARPSEAEWGLTQALRSLMQGVPEEERATAAMPEWAQLLSTEEGRERLWKAIKVFPGHFLEGMVDTAKFPGDVAAGKVDMSTQEGVDQAIDLGFQIATGRLSKLPKTAQTSGMHLAGPTAEPGIKPKVITPEERQANLTSALEEQGEKIRNLMHSHEVSDIFHRGGEEPPPHIDPLIDAEKADQIREDLQRLKDAVRDSAVTATKELSQDHYARFSELHGDGEVGIDSAEIRRIYGEKAPEEGDGLLGWVPNLDRRLPNAELFSDDIYVPQSELLAKTDGKVVNEIGDGLRLRDGGVTVGETKIEAEPRQVIADELPAIRGGAGMEPRNYNGDRKITLRMKDKAERQARQMAEDAGHTWEDLAPEDQQEWMKESREAGVPSMHDIEILNDTGKPVGLINISELEDGKLLHVDNIQAGPEEKGFSNPNFLGYSAIKDLKRQLKQMFPQAEEATGFRISGARWAEGRKPSIDVSTPRVSLDMAAHPQEFRDMLSSIMQPGERVRMHGFERDTTVGEHLRDLYSGAAVSPLTREILDRLIHLVGDVKLSVRHEIPPSREGMPRAGFYNIPRNDIHVLSEAPAYTAVHEAMHAATYKEIERNPAVRANIEQLMDAVDHITGGAHEKAGHPANYAMTNAHEFIAEAFSNTKLQQWMAKQEITPALRAALDLGDRPKTLWQAFVGYIRKALGLSRYTETLLERVLQVGETAFVKEPVKVGVERALQMREERAMRELGMPEPRAPLPTVEDLTRSLEEARRRSEEELGPDIDKRLRRLNRIIDEGGPEADAAMREKEQIVSQLPEQKAGEGFDEDTLRVVRDEFTAMERSDESPEAHIDGVARVLKRYIAAAGRGDEAAQLIVRKGVEEVQKSGGDARALGRDVINRFLSDLSGADREFMEKEFFKPQELGMRGPVEEGKAVGVPKSFLEREERLLKELQEKDWKADQKRQAKQIREQLLPEAMARGKELTKQVREEFQNRPDLAVDKFMSEGQVKFDPDHLTAEQKERLPKDYVAKGGMNPDDLAGTLGYTSGDAMVERLAMLTEDRKRSGLDQKAYFNKQLKAEVDKRLNEEFGPKREELLQEYRDHALSDIQMQLTHVETIRKAAELGIEPKLSLDNFKAMAKSVIDETPIGEIKSARYLQKAGAIAMKVAEAEQKGNHPEAYRLLQQRQLAQLVAKQAMEYEKARKNFDRMVKGFVKTPTAETAKKIDIPYYNWVQQVLARVGYNIDVAALNGRIMLEDHKTLNDFVVAKHAELREVNVPDFALDEKWPGSKTLKDLTYREFSDLHDMVKTMKHEGEYEKFLVKGGEQIALDEAIEDITNQIKGIAALPPETLKKARETPVRDVAKGIWWGHITPEAMWDRLDRGNKQGLLHQLLIYPAARAVNAKLAMLREYGKRFNEIDFKDMDKLVENTLFRDPETGQLIEMRRRNMLGVLAYWGNESNVKKLTEGWGVGREAVEAWLRKNSRPEDWAEMQKVGGIFKDLMKEAQDMSLKTTGVPIKTIDIQPFTDPHGFNREGWYSPVDYEAERPKGKAATGANELERPGYYRVTTDQRYTKERTGKAAPTDLTLGIIPQRMGQMIHDITTRPTAIEMGKILHDERFQRAVNSVYGKAQMDEMRAWLQDMTNQTNVDVAGQKSMNQAMGYLRANVIGNLVGFNPGTVMKHSSTAAFNSISQVGPLNFLKATKELFQTDDATGLRKAKLAYDESKELQGRMHNYADLMRGQGESFKFEQGTIAWLRELNLKFGSMPIAFTDYLSTVPVYWAARNDALARGVPLEMAIDIGDKAVRDAHGAARLTTQPSVMRTTNEMARMYSSLYGFFSHMLQQQYKLSWKARDLLNGQKPLDIEGHWAPHMLGKFMSYYIIPAVIEELVTPYTNEEKDSWGKKVAKGLAMGLSSSLTVVRDLVRTLINPEQRAGGLMDTIMDTPRNVMKDLSGPMNKQKAAHLIKDTIALNGILTGTTNATEGKVAEYITRYSQGLERPKGPWDVAVGLRYGKTDKHPHTFEEWWKHTVEGKR